MPEQAKPPGYLREMILHILRESGRPLTGLRIAALLQDANYSMPPSLVFRAIRRLVVLGKIRKVLTARAYVPVTGGRAISLFCRQCGELCELPAPEIFDALDRAASAAGFRVSGHFVEAPGLCRRCATASTGCG